MDIGRAGAYGRRVRYAPLLLAILATPAAGQQARTAQSVRQAYGSRLDQAAVPAVSGGVAQRLDTRVGSRLDNRLSTRIERYTVPTADLATAYRATPDDGSRRSTAMPAPLPSQ